MTAAPGAHLLNVADWAGLWREDKRVGEGERLLCLPSNDAPAQDGGVEPAGAIGRSLLRQEHSDDDWMRQIENS